MKKTKIICTMGPNTEDETVLKELVHNGMNVARINMSHGTYEDKMVMIALIKKVREETGVPVAILLDTKGPEIRVGDLKNGEMPLEEGSTVRVVTENVVGGDGIIPISYSELPNDVAPGATILLDDGLMELKVISNTETSIDCEVINGGILLSHKGVNVPNVPVKLPAITEQDKKDIEFGISQNIDFIAASFVRNADAILDIKNILAEHNEEEIDVIAKIENQEGVNNIDSILEVADGVMVARGDLGVEIPVEEVPFIQKEIIHKCNKAYKPVITATQMLDSMMRNPKPTRAEVTDVANAIYDGTDAIMLSGETAVGKYPVEALRTMAGIAEATESHLDQDFHMKKKKFRETQDVSSAVAFSSVATAMNVNAKYILCSTMSGETARVVSKFHPDCPIIGLSPIDVTLRKMQLYWGVLPIKTQHVSHSEEILNLAVDTVKEANLVQEDDVVVITAGSVYGKYSITNIMKVFII